MLASRDYIQIKLPDEFYKSINFKPLEIIGTIVGIINLIWFDVS